jgi:hypothetical protein
VFELFFCSLGVIPKVRGLGFFFFLFNAYSQVIDVKDTSSAHSGAFQFLAFLLLRSCAFGFNANLINFRQLWMGREVLFAGLGAFCVKLRVCREA